MSYDCPVVPTSSQKPYRVYRQPRRVRGAADGTIQWDTLEQQHGGGRKRPGVPRHLLRFLRRAVFVAFVLAVVWLLIAFFSFRSAVNEANERLPAGVEEQLAPTNGPALTSSQVTLLVGSDTSAHRKKTEGAKYGLADSLILMRVDVPSRSVSMLSIPRDLYVKIPGFGENKINSAYANGGLKLSLQTIQNFTGVEINHVVEIDFDGFREVVDSVGGVTIDNPSYLSSNEPFDGQDWVFRKGEITLNGRNALAYARMRKTDQPKESDDRRRALRQQRVIDALTSKIASSRSLLHPRDVPQAAVGALTTDLSASELVSTGFGKFWSKGENNLHCRLGGTDDYRDTGQSAPSSVIVPDEQNFAVVRMFLGKQSPVKPDGDVAPGCLRN
ncbi:MAG: cell envelope-related transcriptional attenuator [Thermoleophilia bacterium]|nr:cell envelope-related transcriptional attenuator [Thermoleophilia bacterium]